MNISDKCEKLKKENEIDRESIMEDVVLEWNSNLKKKNKKICDNHVAEQVKKDCKKMDVLKFEIFERVNLCQDERTVYLIFNVVQKFISSENSRKRTLEEKEKRAEFYGMETEWITDGLGDED